VTDYHKRHARIKNLNSKKDLRFLFSKIKGTLTVKLKMIFINHYFRPPPNTEKMLKTFYAETNGGQVSNN
jgi:hypothetical protein